MRAPEDCFAALHAVQEALESGHHVAGYISYEVGYLLEGRLRKCLPLATNLPLLQLGVFSPPPLNSGSLTRRQRGRAYTGPLRHEWDREAYETQFHRLHAFIAAGDIYQGNLTFRSRFAFAGDPLALYFQLREKAAAPHCAYVDDGAHQVLSLSPELFFAVAADGEIVAQPMKGTAPRGSDTAADRSARASLQASEKERAENLMIVDLMRNDLGRIAQPGSVSVPELFAIETYPTVHQMVSTVRAQMRPGTTPRDLLRALFPCGSVTGAPKIRAMEIIRDLEQSPRGAYCGAIGHFAPDGSAAFNVAIRTVTIAGARGELGIGSAVVYDSTAGGEYEECLLKARYFTDAQRHLQLIETFRWCPRASFIRLERHLCRLRNSAAVLGIPCDVEVVRHAIEQVSHGREPLRIRVALEPDGTPDVTAEPIGKDISAWRFVLAEERTFSGDVLLQHKTSWRELYEREYARARANGYDEVLLRNERGEITEGSRTNIFVQTRGRMLTPPLSCGLLPGCLRQEMLDRGECHEAVLHVDDLAKAEAVYFGNSLRGLVPAAYEPSAFANQLSASI